MSRHAEILFGVAGQTLTLDVLEGRPSAPTVSVHAAGVDDDGQTESATSGAASIDAVDTELDVAANRGANTFTVDDATGTAAGRSYLLGGLEWVDVMAVAGETITTRRPLINDHDVGATLVGTRISIAVENTWAADRSKITPEGFRVRWAYSVNGAPTVAASYAVVVRYASRALLTAQDVDSRIPGWIDRLPPDFRADQGVTLIASAFEALRFDCLGDAKLLHAIRDTQALRELAIYRANLISVEAQAMAGSANVEAVRIARDLYTQRYQQLIREPKVSEDPNGQGGAAPARRLPVWRR